MEDFEKLTINAIEGIEMKREDARAMVPPHSPKVAPMNWTTIEILKFYFFHNINKTFLPIIVPMRTLMNNEPLIGNQSSGYKKGPVPLIDSICGQVKA